MINDYKDDADIRYVNISLYNPTDSPIPARIVETRNEPIIEIPKEYEASVVRFRLSIDSIPIFQPSLFPGSNPPIYDSKEFISLNIAGNSYVTRIFVSPQILANGVTSYQQWLNVINNDLFILFILLKLENPGYPQTLPPKLAIDPKTQLISFYIENTYLDSEPDASRIDIGLNYTLHQYLRFPYKQYNTTLPQLGTNYILSMNNSSLLLPPLGTRVGYPIVSQNIPDPAYQVQQEQQALFTWNELKSVSFISNLLPINQEAQPGSSVLGQPGQSNIASFQSSTQAILTDFDIAPNEELATSNNVLQYTPTGEYRMFTLNGTNPIRQIDISAIWTSTTGVSQALFLNPGGGMFLKIMFRRKRNAV